MTEQSTDYPTISVLIPTKNGGETIAELLAMLSIQTVSVDKVLIADSASEDNTVEFAQKYGAEVISIAPDTFDHGGTRTFLCQNATHELLIFLTQDAVPKRRDALEKLIEPLLNDEKVASSYGRQLPAFNADHFAASLREFNYGDRSSCFSKNDARHAGLKTVFTSNSFACYRRNALKEVGFFKDGLIFGEDTVAVGRLLENGWKHAYASEAQVYHSHNNTPLQEFKRYFDIGVLHTNEKWLLDTFGNAEGRGKTYFFHELRCIKQKKKYDLIPELFIRLALKYCGYRFGRYYRRLPSKVIHLCTLHPKWWVQS